MSMRGLRFSFVLLVVLAALAAGAWVLVVGSRSAVAAEKAGRVSQAPTVPASRELIQALSAPEMEGRGLGTQGLARASALLERTLRGLGLETGVGKSYRQRVLVKTGVKLGKGGSLAGVAASDWTPLAFSKAGTFAGDVVFAGYGIDAPELGYRDLEGQDLKGKVALVLRYEPQEKDHASPFDGSRPSRWSAQRYKATRLRELGAAAVIFVSGPLQDGGQDKLPVLVNDGPESDAGVPVLQVKTSIAAGWLAKAGMDLGQLQKEIDRDLRPRSRLVPGLRLRGRVALETTFAQADNLVAKLPGRGSLAGETIVLGAHYDHLGYGGARSMKPDLHAIHPGADDNASGTAAVLRAAHLVSSALRDAADRRTVVVTLFTAEEMGLGGSAHFVKSPPPALGKVVAMVNLDMVGRLRDQELVALGVESGNDWRARIEAASTATGLKVKSSGDGYGPSDQTPFYAAGNPVLHLFTGAHDAYHTPDDVPATINYEGLEQIERFTGALVQGLATGEAPRYARATSAPAMAGDSRGYGAYLGTVPDYRAMEGDGDGVLLTDVRPGSPAERAGIAGGDLLVELAGQRVKNLYDMTFALQDHKPGETVTVVVVRAGAKKAVLATLGTRGAGRESSHAAAKSAPGAASPASPSASAAPGVPPPGKDAAPHPPVAKTDAPARSPAASVGASSEASTGIEFYRDRPGTAFVVGAGKPFAQAFAGEAHFAEVRQLTFGGENAEAYFSPDGTKLIYQATTAAGACDQQYVLDLATGESKLVSTGKGRTTCGYFDFPEADRIVYASTHGASDACPAPPDQSQGYVWAIYDSFDLYEAGPDGTNPRRLTDSPGYDAEATWCHRGGSLVFTSMRDGDLELYSMNEAGAVRRLTSTPGYDGGAFFSPDCSELVFRASRPTGQALEDYNRLLKMGLVRPTAMELFVMKSDGSDVRQVTSSGAASFAPYFFPDGERIIYSSNAGDPKKREFDLYVVSKKGGTPVRVTTAPGFDGFPQFSPDGRYIVWGSNRADAKSRDTNLFIARWVE